MPINIYDSMPIYLLDGRRIDVVPLKLKYLKEFMDAFDLVKYAKDDSHAISLLADCVLIAMQQLCPEIKTIEQLEDVTDMQNIYDVIEYAANIKIKPNADEEVSEQAKEEGITWENLDLAKMESEVFLTGAWKNYDELEESMCLDEILSTIMTKRDLADADRKFAAAIQGIKLDDEEEIDEWEEMKARVLSGGKAANSKDIISLQGFEAEKAGFGIGMGLEYEDLT